MSSKCWRQCGGSGGAFGEQLSQPTTKHWHNCPNFNSIGNTICNIENLNDKCYHDDGDCCNQTLVGNKECDKINFFKTCGTYDGGDCCSKKALIGNGNCDEEIYIPFCNFDGGECAYSKCTVE